VPRWPFLAGSITYAGAWRGLAGSAATAFGPGQLPSSAGAGVGTGTGWGRGPRGGGLRAPADPSTRASSTYHTPAASTISSTPRSRAWRAATTGARAGEQAAVLRPKESRSPPDRSSWPLLSRVVLCRQARQSSDAAGLRFQAEGFDGPVEPVTGGAP